MGLYHFFLCLNGKDEPICELSSNVHIFHWKTPDIYNRVRFFGKNPLIKASHVQMRDRFEVYLKEVNDWCDGELFDAINKDQIYPGSILLNYLNTHLASNDCKWIEVLEGDDRLKELGNIGSNVYFAQEMIDHGFANEELVTNISDECPIDIRMLVWLKSRQAKNRLEMVRDAVRTRAIVVYWLGKAMETACAEGGTGRQADLGAFVAVSLAIHKNQSCSRVIVSPSV